MKRLLLAALLAPMTLLPARVSAADLANRSDGDIYAPAPAPAFSWQGLYLGVNAGYAWSSFENGSHLILGHPSGGLVGFTGGYNFVPAANILVGLEADFDFTGMKANQMPYFGLAGEGSVDHLFTLRGRAGYTVDRALLYVTGGFATSENTAKVNNVSTGLFSTESRFQPGWALGAGLEFLLTQNLSAKAEYIFTSIGSDRFFDFSAGALQVGVNTSALKGGLNYHF